MPQKWVDIPFPVRLNLDGALWGLNPDESPNLLNMITWEPGQIRQRRKFQRQVNMAPAVITAGDLPFSIMTAANIAAGATNPTLVPSRALVGCFTSQSGVTIPYRNAYPNGPWPSGYSDITTSKVKLVYINADNPAAITSAAFTDLTTSFGADYKLLAPFGQFANADFSTFGTSVGRLAAGTYNGSYTGTHLVRWAGSNRANTTIANCVLTAGSVAVTVTGNPTPSLAGTFMNAGTNDPLGSRYNYYVLSHVAGTNAVTLSKPYGLGDPAVVNHAAASVNFSPIQVVQSSMGDVQQCCMYLSRLFVGRPTAHVTISAIQAGVYPQAVAWSNVNEPERWTTTNIAILDNNPIDPVMGFQPLVGALIIFRRFSIWQMTGTDESSFTFRQISDLGCLDARSITPYLGGVFFMSDRGMHYFDGYQFDNIVSPSPGHGIYAKYVSTSERFAFPETYPLTSSCTTILPRTDVLLMTGQDLEAAANARHDQYAYHIPSQAWTKLNTAGTDQLILFTKPGSHLNNQASGFLGSEGMVLLDHLYEPEVFAAGGDLGRYDETYNSSSGASISTAVRSTVQFPDVRPWNGQTGRLHEIIVEHNIWKPVSGSQSGPDLVVGTDPFFGDVLVTNQSATAGNIAPRYQATETLNTYNYRYTTSVQGTTWPLEGTTFRMKLTTEGVTLDANNAAHPPKYFRLRALLELTDRDMVDNPVT